MLEFIKRLIQIVGAERFDAVDLATDNYIPPASFGGVTKGISVAVAGNIKVDGEKYGTNVTVYATQGDHPYRVTKIYKTGTDATGIVALG